MIVHRVVTLVKDDQVELGHGQKRVSQDVRKDLRRHYGDVTAGELVDPLAPAPLLRLIVPCQRQYDQIRLFP